MVMKLRKADFSGVCVGFVISNVFGLRYNFLHISLFRLLLNNRCHYCPALQAGFPLKRDKLFAKMIHRIIF